ncbi:Protein of unknown function DUF4228 [Macleaya cordata]|uniref:Plastid movement impaired 2 n=1 Tax=Macleaya cordata TaxID=56857 RepID=A0A200QVN2_MACCD|nr:Protein of unknown function DUF4228 [Macleaya cordata]
MGNSLGGKRKTAKVMKVDGETLKIKTPTRVQEVVKDYPGHVLIESEAVKHFGIRAKPLQPQQELKPRKLYFLIELPKIRDEKVPRRVRSGIQMTAKDRLESLKLSRRSVSDLTILNNSKSFIVDEPSGGGSTMRIRVRLPKSQVEKLVEESKDGTEAAEKIMDLCIGSNSNGNDDEDDKEGIATRKSGELLMQQQNHWKPGLGSIEETMKSLIF